MSADDKPLDETFFEQADRAYAEMKGSGELTAAEAHRTLKEEANLRHLGAIA